MVWDVTCLLKVLHYHGARFHQDISMMEQRVKEKWNAGILADYCWGKTREDHTPHKKLKQTKVV